MRHFTKKLSVLLLLMLLTVLPVMGVSAAGKVPGKVKSLKAKNVNESSVQLSWSRASNANGYQIYQVNPENGALKKVAKTTKTSYTVKKLKIDRTYVYQVCAYKKSGKKTVMSKLPSPQAAVTTKMLNPAKVSKLEISGYGNATLSLKWNKSKNATGYIIYLYNEQTKEYKKLATTKSTSYTTGKLTEGQEYKFMVCAYRSAQGKTVQSAESAVVSAKAKGFSSAAKKVHGRYFNATLRRNSQATVIDTKKTKTLKKGTKVTATRRGSSMLIAIMKDGTQVKVKGSDLRYNSLKTVTKDYSKREKEAFINEKGYSSSTRRLIWISQYTTTVNVFSGSKGNWKLVYSTPCVIGKDGRTPTGVHKIRFQEPYQFGGYRIYFTWNPVKQWGNSFHGRTNSVTRGAHSSGCIRLSQSALNYIRDTCGRGTTVVSY